MTFRFPIEIAKDLVAVIGQFSKQAMEMHGIGLVSHDTFPLGTCSNTKTSSDYFLG